MVVQSAAFTMAGMDTSAALLAILSRLLPRVVEEGTDAETIAEAKLVQRLAESAGVSLEQAATTLALVRCWLQALSVLEPRRLAAGEWRFVSFPAFLLAKSLLNGLSTAEFRLLEPGFWDAGDYRVDKQRALIKQVEELRAALPLALMPIRRVWVAWAWVALDSRFLLVRREDPVVHRDGSRGEFVFPGGRVSPQDLPDLPLSARLDFFDPNQPANMAVAEHAFRAALLREIHEELDIPPSGLTAATVVREPVRYLALEGAKSAYSATEYLIQSFKLELHATGKTALLRCLAVYPERFDWFTTDELAAGSNAAGARAFVDAIRNELPLDAECYAVHIGGSVTLNEPVEIPSRLGEPFNVGITGRERQIHIPLEPEEVATLAWLAAIRRNEPVTELAEGVSTTSAGGWILVDDDVRFAKLRQLASKLEGAGLPLLDFHERGARLNAANEMNFSPSLFSLVVLDERRGKSYKLTLIREEIRSPLGVAPARQIVTSLPEKFGNAVYSLEQGDPGPALNDFDTVKRMQRDIRGALNDIGLRALIRQVDGVPELTVLRSEAEPG